MKPCLKSVGGKLALIVEPVVVWGGAASLVLGSGAAAAWLEWRALLGLLGLRLAAGALASRLAPRAARSDGPAARAWRRILREGLPSVRFATPCVFPARDDVSTRRRVILSHPHGLVAEAQKRTLPERTRCVAMADKMLILLNPLADTSARLYGFVGLEKLKHVNVERIMKEKRHDICVMAGGFVEAAAGTNVTNRIWPGTWRYWLRQCLKHDYDVAVQLVYGGTQIYLQPECGWRARAALARAVSFPTAVVGPPLTHRPPLTVIGLVDDLALFRSEDARDLEAAVTRAYESLLSKVRDLIVSHPPPQGCAPFELMVAADGSPALPLSAL